MKNEIEVNNLLQFIECFMYGHYENIIISYPSGYKIYAGNTEVDKIKKIGIEKIKGIWFDLEEERFVIEVK